MKQNEFIFEFMRNTGNHHIFLNTLFRSIKKPKMEKPQRMILLQNLRLAGKAKLKDIAAHSGLSVQNLCIIYKTFEKEGLIAKEVDLTDHRNIYYFITKHGLKAIQKSKELFAAEVWKVFTKLPKKDLEDLKNHLKGANDIIEKVL